MDKVLISDFVDFIKKSYRRKDGYIMGSRGENPRTGYLNLTITECRSSWKENGWYYTQYSGKQRDKALYWREHATRVFDCNGLSESFYEISTGRNINTKARYNYAQWCDPKGKGMIPAEYRVPGAAVFWGDSASSIHHVAYLYRPVDATKPEGDWYIIEARGVMYGVVKTRLEERQPNFWGWMTKYYDYGTDAETGGFEVLKNGDEGEAVKTLQTNLIRLGYDCGYWGADGDFGDATELAVRAFETLHDLPVDGVFGAEDAAKLEAALVKLDAAPEELPRWVLIMGGDCWVRTAPNTDGAKLGVARKGTKLSYGGQTSEDGWLLVAYDNQNGWVSGKYGKLES